MDYEGIFDPDNVTNSTNDFVYINHATSGEIALQSLKFLICVIGTGVDILIVYIILKFKNMKKPLNIYIMNWLICDALYIFIDPAEYRLYTFIRGLETGKEILCFMFSSMLIIRTIDLIFMIVLLLHWFFERTKIEVFEKHCYKIVAGVWIFGLIELILESLSCIFDSTYENYGDLFVALLELFLLISLSIIHCMRRCSNPFNDSTALPIALITSFMLCSICMVIISVLFHLVSHEVFLIFYYSGQLFNYLYPLVMFYLFYTLDPMFAASVRLLFRIIKPDEATAAFDDLDEDTDCDENPHII